MALRRASANPAESRRKKRSDLPEASLDVKSKMLEPRKSRSASAARAFEENDRVAELQSQLPLQRGRKVAFCQPPREDQASSEEEWILATVMNTIQGDKYRYVVQDAEDESSGGPYVSITHTQYMEYDNRFDHSFACECRHAPFGGPCGGLACAGFVPRHQLLLLGHRTGRWSEYASTLATKQGRSILLTLVTAA